MKSPFGSDEDVYELARRLVTSLQMKLENTDTQDAWSVQNFNFLRGFDYREGNVKHFPPNSGSRQGEFLWDYVAYVQGKGVLLAAESEWEIDDIKKVEEDFEKLLYVLCPIKLMVCRRNKKYPGSSTAEQLSKYARDVSTHYFPGEIFILCCVGWRDPTSGKRDDEFFCWQVPQDSDPNRDAGFNFKCFKPYE